mmetsp:Transcript_15195/g.39131  ORF Transcript_15195/g.39131 Transcript_15195/m.39131 type:complete len:248 (-) Transcript_15195:344-1087(-)
MRISALSKLRSAACGTRPGPTVEANKHDLRQWQLLRVPARQQPATQDLNRRFRRLGLGPHLLLHPLLQRHLRKHLSVLLVAVLVARDRTQQRTTGACLLHEHDHGLPAEALRDQLDDRARVLSAVKADDHRRRALWHHFSQIWQGVLQLGLGLEVGHGGPTSPLHILDDLLHGAAGRGQLQHPLAVAEPDDCRVAIYGQPLRRDRICLGVQPGQHGTMPLLVEPPGSVMKAGLELLTMRATGREEVN